MVPAQGSSRGVGFGGLVDLPICHYFGSFRGRFALLQLLPKNENGLRASAGVCCSSTVGMIPSKQTQLGGVGPYHGLEGVTAGWFIEA